MYYTIKNSIDEYKRSFILMIVLSLIVAIVVSIKVGIFNGIWAFIGTFVLPMVIIGFIGSMINMGTKTYTIILFIYVIARGLAICFVAING